MILFDFVENYYFQSPNTLFWYFIQCNTVITLAFNDLHNLTLKEFRYDEKRFNSVFRRPLENIPCCIMTVRDARAQRIFKNDHTRWNMLCRNIQSDVAVYTNLF
jgi:hypothetical protein